LGTIRVPPGRRRGAGVLTRSAIDTKGRETMKWEDGKEYPVVKIEVSSESHPYYTGKQKIVDTAGRVEKFKRRYTKKTTETKA
jgi:large subunit ribosomal protein L31